MIVFAIPRSSLASTWMLQRIDTLVLDISIVFRCQGSSLGAVLGSN